MDVDVFLKCNSDVNKPRNFEVCMKMVFFFERNSSMAFVRRVVLQKYSTEKYPRI